MTKSDHEEKRRAFWDASALFHNQTSTADMATRIADKLLAERDKRFPAPEGGGK